jgi:trehalose 6-phosphate phosphatase
MPIEPTTEAGRAALAAITDDPHHCLAAFDYDGTLAPIVADPTQAVPHPRTVEALAQLASSIGTVAIVTGRPARTAVELAGFADHDALDGLVVVGHYGLERWDASTDTVTAAEPLPGLDVVRQELPQLLASHDLADAAVEDKGLSVAVHTRRLPDARSAYDVLVTPLTELAERNGLAAEPGRFVVELRPPGMDKGAALRSLVDERQATSVVFTGDDLGDLPAYDEVGRLRSDGVPGLLVCSGSDEVTVLAERADVVVDGPAGVVAFIDDLTAAL